MDKIKPNKKQYINVMENGYIWILSIRPVSRFLVL